MTPPDGTGCRKLDHRQAHFIGGHLTPRSVALTSGKEP
jgi:hypothetical protein